MGVALKSLKDIYAGASGPHYALLHSGDHVAIREAKEIGIEPVLFDGYGEPLINVLKELGNSVEEEEDIKITVKVTSTPILADGHASRGFIYDCDTPPPVDTWVGRVDELQLIDDPKVKVIAITGLGGQGKSSLAAKYLERNSSQFTISDWRDCKEQDNTLHTHLVRIIERITKGESTASDLATEDIHSLVRSFLSLSVSIRGVFVFDNIDQYVDADSSQAVRGMHALIQGALKSPGSSRFIFTTRPKLAYDSPEFRHIELAGLNIDEVKGLFALRQVEVSSHDLEDLQELVQGHPLWIGLIANQVLTNRIKIPALVARIRSGKEAEAGLPTAMLQEIWKSLKSQQQKLLRYLAEIVRPETEAQIQTFANPKLSGNQFRTTLRHLKTLGLVVVKSPNNALDTIELHPLVREFVRRQFSSVDRKPYILQILIYFDEITVKLRSLLTRAPAFEVLQNWAVRVELLTNSGDVRQALEVLEESRAALLSGGLSEDYVRLACGILAKCDRSNSAIVESLAFENTFAELIEVLSQLGRFEDAEEYLGQFEKVTAGATARYICYCRLRTYYHWTKQEYETAKEWGRKGVTLKARSNIDTYHTCAHNLALSQRDSGEMDSALKEFLGGCDLQIVVDPLKIDAMRHGHFYGNIGRTLSLMNRDEEAFNCLLKSAWLLERDHQPSRLNLAWAACWLAELLERRQAYSEAYISYRRAAGKWHNMSPFRADSAIEGAGRVAVHVDSRLRDADDADIENKYQEMLEELKKFK